MKKLFVFSMMALGATAHADVTVKATNKLQFARPAQTIEITLRDLDSIKVKSPAEIVVKDDAGKELATQLVDTDYDDLHKPDILIFQSDFGAGESKTFKLSAGKPHHHTADDFHAYGRF